MFGNAACTVPALPNRIRSIHKVAETLDWASRPRTDAAQSRRSLIGDLFAKNPHRADLKTEAQ